MLCNYSIPKASDKMYFNLSCSICWCSPIMRKYFTNNSVDEEDWRNYTATENGTRTVNFLSLKQQIFMSCHLSLTMLSLEMTQILSIFPQGQKCLDLWSLTAESSSFSVDNSWQSLHRNVFCLVFQISLLSPFHCS